ncbi:hypothetical protein Tco_0601635 [Tanacetum coccineum]
MVKKGKNFSGKVEPLFDSMLVQQTEDEGDASKRPSDSQPIPSPPHLSEDQPQIQPDPSPRPSPTTHIADSIPKGSGGDHGAQAKEIKDLKAQVKKLKKGVKPLITHHKAWIKTRLARKTSLKKKEVHKEYVSKQGRKSVKTFKGEPYVHKDPAFDDLDDFVDVDVDDILDYMETEDVQEERRNKGTDKGNEGTDKGNKGTDKQDGGTDYTKVSTDRQGEGTTDQDEGKSVTQTAPTPTLTTSTPTTPTPIVFGDDETIAQVLIIMSQNKENLKEKEKGVEIRNVEETERPRPTLTRSILTLRPLPKIDLKDKGKKRIKEEDESDTESEGITESKKKFKQLANNEEVARKARLNADKILAEKLQEKEREMYTIEQRTKFLHDTIAAQRRFLAQQRSEAIRNKPPSRNQLRNQMMTYLKHVGGKKHSDLKTKSFDEIQVLYEKIKRSDDSFIAIGSAEDEKVIKEMNEQAADASKKRVKKDDSVKGEIKAEKGTKKRKSGHVKMIARKRPRPQPDDDSDDEHRKCLRIVTFEGTIDSEIMETKSFIARLHKVSSPDGNYLVVYRVNGHFRAFNYLMEVTDLEANLEQFKIEQAAINSEAAKQLALLQATIEKNKVEVDRQFSEIMNALKALQPPTTLPEDTTMIDTEKSGEDCGNLDEFMVASDVEEAAITTPIMVVAEELGQKLIYDFGEADLMLGSEGKSIERVSCDPPAGNKYVEKENIKSGITSLNRSGSYQNPQQKKMIKLKDGTVIYMPVEKRYPLSKELLQQMIDLGLEVKEESTAALQLDQTVPELAIPEQTATGKGIPNPLMAGSLPKTIKPTELDVAVLLKRQVADEDG